MQYVGITVGPIGETMQMTSTPAGLWLASYLFSSLVRDICQQLQEQGREILTLPEGFRVKEHLEDHGVGSYHDRIYYVTEEPVAQVEQSLPQLYAQVLHRQAREMAKTFQAAGAGVLDYGEASIETFLHDYLQVHFVVFTEAETQAKGIAATLADALDALELSQHVCTEQKRSYMRKLVRGTQDDSNAYLRHYPAFARLATDEAFPLNYVSGKEVRIRDLGAIAAGIGLPDRKAERDKTANYIAIVQCDGDNMGLTLASTDELGQPQAQQARLHNFSRLCMAYTTQAAALVTAYGGVVIYAGGDDLLFLAPVQATRQNAPCANVWELCRAIGQAFDKIFQASDAAQKPTLSVGMAIQYHKFPLYESFLAAQRCLFGEAKHFVHGAARRKNNLSVHLRKHSGQSVGFTCCLETATGGEQYGVFAAYLAFLQAFYSQQDTSLAEENQLMHSVIYHLEEQRVLFQQALDTGSREVIAHAFANSFDNSGQTFGAAMLAQLEELAYTVQRVYQGGALRGVTGAEPAVALLTSMLRMAKFLAEED